uniref:SBF1/SBF2 domain-containing protein n=1 Tax=Odontella aurita TaxID=265563 RepID=A0A7S4JJ05_9STRA
MSSDDDVEDAAYALLNVLNALDLTRRSARVAAEGALLSAANSQLRCLRGLVRLEREGAEERLRRLREAEEALEAVDVRSDLDAFVEREKRDRPGGATRMGDDDDGGVASALAVLNSHGEQQDGNFGVGGMSHFGGTRAAATGMSTYEGWGDGDGGENPPEGVVGPDERLDLTRDEIVDIIALIFDDKDPQLLTPSEWGARDGNADEDCPATDDQRAAAIESFRSKIDLLSSSLSERHPRARVRRSNACYALNTRRSLRTEISGRVRFDALCDVFGALLSGCDREEADVANAKMCMMLAVTFYVADRDKENAKNGGSENEEGGDGAVATQSEHETGRDRRVYVKSKLLSHPIWSDEDFWVQALFQCVSESLTQSGVMSNFDRPAVNGGGGGGHHATHRGNQPQQSSRRIKWFDLTPDERHSAASQVHAVIFAQLSALAHSMVEFGCDVRRACAFVRTLSVRHQLPLGQRTVLLQHLVRKCGEEQGVGTDGATVKDEEERIAERDVVERF